MPFPPPTPRSPPWRGRRRCGRRRAGRRPGRRRHWTAARAAGRRRRRPAPRSAASWASLDGSTARWRTEARSATSTPSWRRSRRRCPRPTRARSGRRRGAAADRRYAARPPSCGAPNGSSRTRWSASRAGRGRVVSIAESLPVDDLRGPARQPARRGRAALVHSTRVVGGRWTAAGGARSPRKGRPARGRRGPRPGAGRPGGRRWPLARDSIVDLRDQAASVAATPGRRCSSGSGPAAAPTTAELAAIDAVPPRSPGCRRPPAGRAAGRRRRGCCASRSGARLTSPLRPAGAPDLRHGRCTWAGSGRPHGHAGEGGGRRRRRERRRPRRLRPGRRARRRPRPGHLAGTEPPRRAAGRRGPPGRPDRPRRLHRASTGPTSTSRGGVARSPVDPPPLRPPLPSREATSGLLRNFRVP